MGATAARKAARVVANTRRILAIELLTACQALDFRRPLETSRPLAAAAQLVGRHAPVRDRDRVLSPEIEAIAELVRSGAVRDAAASICANLD
jgi:histidine ammonia-lyase